MTTHPLTAPATPDRTLDAAHLAAIRAARAALHDAARRGAADEVERALAPFVHAMWRADFTPQTIRSLVAAAIDAGLPTARGPARRTQRAATIARWVSTAELLADRLPARGRRPGNRTPRVD